MRSFLNCRASGFVQSQNARKPELPPRLSCKTEHFRARDQFNISATFGFFTDDGVSLLGHGLRPPSQYCYAVISIDVRSLHLVNR